jgi:hypothetical protein
MGVVDAATLMLADVAADAPVTPNVSVRAPALPDIARFVNAATPASALTVDVPLSVPPPLAIAAVTEAVDVVRFPAASRSSTTGWRDSAAPLVPSPGCVRITNVLTLPGVTVAVSEAVSDPLVAVIVAVPAFAPVTVPLEETEATAASLADQLTVCPDSAWPSFAWTVALMVVDAPDAMVTDPEGESAIDEGVLSTGVTGGVPVGASPPLPPQAVSSSVATHTQRRACGEFTRIVD